MIPKECKRLAEVDFPIAVVSKHSAREKSIRHGHPSTLHLWWARRPLASCRSMLLGLLLPDPCDSLCPDNFKEKARSLLPQVQGAVGPKDEDLRHSLLKFIGDFANWDLSSDQTYLEVSRGLVKAAHPEETPLIVDPFSGGGSIPLEALRLGCEAFASDLNPVACLILKVMLEDIPRHGPELADELRRVGSEIKAAAEKELAEFYPPDPDGSKPIAYLWSRTVRCEAPNCGAEIPLVRSFWLSKKASRKRALRYKLVRPIDSIPYIDFEIFEPKADSEVPNGTVTRAKASCLCCNTVLSPDRVRAQLREQHGGAEVLFDGKGMRNGGARLLSIVTLKTGEQGRLYRMPTDADYNAIRKIKEQLSKIEEQQLLNGLSPIPDEPVDEWHHDVNRMPMYGMTRWGDLFTSRQKVALVTLIKKLHEVIDCSTPLGVALCHLLALSIGRSVDQMSSLVRWLQTIEAVASTFGRQALPIVWDFCEINPVGDASANFSAAQEWIIKVIETSNSFKSRLGQMEQADARNSPLPNDSCAVWFTDPPYYDAIYYAHCSDYFFVWLKRILLNHSLLRDPFDAKNPLTPKEREIVVDSTTTKGHGIRTPAYYEKSMSAVFGEGCRILKDSGIGCVVFAHKSTEGWEALLSGMIKGGWVITGSWPIATERTVRVRAQDSAALATSVHLVCRPRQEDAPVGDWGDVLKELPNRVGDWMERLQKEHVRGADLVFACIGPALEIFSRYSKVETADGQKVKLAEYLEKVWEVVGRLALEQILGTAEAKARNGAAGALEEDSRLTALFLWTLQSTNGESAAGNGDKGNEDSGDDDEDESPKGKQKGFSLVFDVVRRFAQPLGIHLEAWEGRIIETKKGVVRLFPINERAKQLFGEDGAQAIADRIESSPEGSVQLALFAGREEGAVPEIRGKSRQRKGVLLSEETMKAHRGATTLDRVHAAMLLQASGRANALRALLKAEQDRSPDFLRLANALSALYPKDSEEKRLLDAMLLAVPR